MIGQSKIKEKERDVAGGTRLAITASFPTRQVSLCMSQQ